MPRSSGSDGTETLEQGRRLRDKVRATGAIFAVTYNYSGYPLVRHARAMVQAGELGAIRIIQVEYPQDWLSEPLDDTGQKQADWRTDPARSGAGGALVTSAPTPTSWRTLLRA